MRTNLSSSDKPQNKLFNDHLRVAFLLPETRSPMKRILRLLFPLLCLSCFAQVPVAPATIPHITFVNGSGGPCATCSLYTYIAGTTTPQATYTDSTGTSQNPNPIILDAAGGANIWLGSNSYKFILKDTTGATIWSVDNVNAGSLFPCSTAGAIQIANSSTSGLTCDPSITINTVTHTINVGSLPTNHVTIGALGTPTSWTFDTTSPATALASLGAGAIGSGTANQIAIYPTSGNNVQGSSTIPNGITVITRAPTDNSANPASTAYVASPGGIGPTALIVNGGAILTDNQGNGTKLQHSTGTTATGDCAQYDANGNVVDAGAPCAIVSTPRTCNSFGCYRINGDGTIEEWGTVSVPPSGNAFNSATITYPFPFTTQAVPVGNTIGIAGSGDSTTPPGVEIQSASLTGATFFMARVVIASAGGGNFNNTITLSWHAFGY
jgi:hypothetical protein